MSELGLRASDAERDRAADGLRQHHADGRISTDELEERTGRAYAATTLGDLDQLFADLPRSRAAEGERRPRRLGLGSPPFRLLLIALLLAVTMVASAHALFFLWPLLFLAFLRFGLMRRAWWGRSNGWPGANGHY